MSEETNDATQEHPSPKMEDKVKHESKEQESKNTEERTSSVSLDEVRTAGKQNVEEEFDPMAEAQVPKSERGSWGNHIEYFLSSLGLAVGLGNIWRFPYVCYMNGGGTFLVPYCIMLFMVGLPMFFMELALGQYTGNSATKIYARLVPGLSGIGYGMVLIPIIINAYYTVIMGYSWFFLFSGFTSKLPWSDCSNDFNTYHCFSEKDNTACMANSSALIFYNKSCVSVDQFCQEFGLTSLTDNFTHCDDGNNSRPIPLSEVTSRTSASEDFWHARVLGLDVHGGHMTNNWENWGNIRWEIVGCLALSWTLVCLSLIKGIQSYGKVVYFTTLFPYVVLTALLGYVSTLEGFMEGLYFFFIPDWTKLKQLDVWHTAAGQIFFSLSVAYGAQLTLASYNGFNTNCHRDTILIGICNSLTSLYAGLVVFGVVGFISVKTGTDIDKVITAGPGLAFVVYPEGVAEMDVAPLFSFMFFFMLILLAISSVCGNFECCMSVFFDAFPGMRKRRIIVTIIGCVIMFLFGFAICYDSGFLLFTLMDNRASNAILCMAFLELICVSWFYGAERFMNHITEDMGMKLPKIVRTYWISCWIFITPALIGTAMALSWVSHSPDQLFDYKYPALIQGLGWLIELSPILAVLFFSVITAIRKSMNGEDIAYLKRGPMMRPKKSWGPRQDAMLTGIQLQYSNDISGSVTKSGIENNAFE